MTDLPLDPIAIDVGSLVQRTVASLYSHLVTRQTGRAVRLAIEAQLADAGTLSLSLIDFSEVSVLDFSCADEVVAKLIQRYAGDHQAEAFFVLGSVAEAHRDPIEVTLQRQGLGIVAETAPGRFELLGDRTPPEEAVWVLLEARGFFTGEDAVELLGTDEERSALDSLVRRRLAFRSPITGRVHALSRLVQNEDPGDGPKGSLR